MACCCGLVVTLGLLGIVGALLYVFLTWNFNSWKKRGVKGPKPRAFFGSFPSMVTQKRHMTYDMTEIYKQFKHDEDFVGIYNVRTPQLLALSPELAHKVYVTDFKNFRDNEAGIWFDEKNDKFIANNPFMLRGDEWKERRQEITPGLTTNRIKAVYPVTQEVCKRLVDYIREKSSISKKDGIDGKDLSLRYTCEVVTDSVLGVRSQSLSDNPTPILEMTKTLFHMSTTFTVYMILAGLLPQIRHFWKAKFFQIKTEQFFYGLMKTAFDMRQKQKVDRVDFLNYMLQLQEKKGLANDELLGHIMTFLLDGFETSASVIAHCLLQLARKPSIQETLLKEITSNSNENGEIDFEKLQELPYLDQCIHESMRLISPLLFSTKLCTEPCELVNKNGSKVQLKVNDVINIPVHAFHHDEQYYPNPEEYIPERFNPENGGVKKFREMGVFYPFGDGPRICLGMRFALTQTKAAIAEIVRNFKMKVNPKTRTDNLLHSTAIIGELAGGVWLEFESRK